MFRNLKKLTPMRNFIRYASYEDSKTTAIFLNEALDAPLMVNSISRTGFKLNNNFQVIGSLILFPKTVLSWNVLRVEDINEKSLSLFTVLEPKVDILILGVGDKGAQVDKNALLYMRNKGLTMEILPTEQACHLYNFLATEGRFVAAAIIPPSNIELPKIDEELDFEKGYSEM